MRFISFILLLFVYFFFHIIIVIGRICCELKLGRHLESIVVLDPHLSAAKGKELYIIFIVPMMRYFYNIEN